MEFLLQDFKFHHTIMISSTILFLHTSLLWRSFRFFYFVVELSLHLLSLALIFHYFLVVELSLHLVSLVIFVILFGCRAFLHSVSIMVPSYFNNSCASHFSFLFSLHDVEFLFQKLLQCFFKLWQCFCVVMLCKFIYITLDSSF